MPKVVGPLFSEEAHGKFGNALIFQGVTVKTYKEPANPRSAAQVAHRDFFADVTKMLKACIGTGRDTLSLNFLETWFQFLYGEIEKDDQDFFADALVLYGSFSAGSKVEWDENAPFTLTFEAPGQVFFSVIRYVYDKIVYDGGELEGLQAYAETESLDAVLWWTGEETLMVGARVYNSLDQQITPGLWASLAFDTGVFGTAGMFDGVGSPGEIEIVANGLYKISTKAGGEFNVLSSVEWEILKNGAVDLISEEHGFDSVSAAEVLEMTVEADLLVGDVITVRMRASGGAPFYLLTQSNYYPYFSVIRLGASV